jgi:hypothetical protein
MARLRRYTVRLSDNEWQAITNVADIIRCKPSHAFRELISVGLKSPVLMRNVRRAVSLIEPNRLV